MKQAAESRVIELTPAGSTDQVPDHRLAGVKGGDNPCASRPHGGNICENSVVWLERRKPREEIVNGLIYLVGLIVVIMFILSFLGLR